MNGRTSVNHTEENQINEMLAKYDDFPKNKPSATKKMKSNQSPTKKGGSNGFIGGDKRKSKNSQTLDDPTSVGNQTGINTPNDISIDVAKSMAPKGKKVESSNEIIFTKKDVNESETKFETDDTVDNLNDESSMVQFSNEVKDVKLDNNSENCIAYKIKLLEESSLNSSSLSVQQSTNFDKKHTATKIFSPARI